MWGTKNLEIFWSEIATLLLTGGETDKNILREQFSHIY
jgi:hypothetical protein